MSSLGLFDLSGKTALVTGCDSGIGQAMAISLAEAGADIIGASTAKECLKTKKNITAAGRKFTYYKVDLSIRSDLYAFILKVKEKHKHIDILINNAEISLSKPVVDHPDEFWDIVLATNLDAQFILGREFGKGMVKNGGGKIIFTCALQSFQGGVNMPGYTASKSAIVGLVRALANEWGRKGVAVNGIAPGYIATKNTKALCDDFKANESILERIPNGRWGEPEDFKGPALFLASAASNYVNGTVLTVDGGWMAR